MARFLVDTNICIYIAKQKPPQVLARFQKLSPGAVAMSIVTWGELMFGAAKSRAPDRSREVLFQLAELIPVLAISVGVGEHYGAIRAALERIGRPVGNNDLWLAAHAIGEGLTLVTNDEKEFARVPGLKVVNWVDPPAKP